MTHEIHKNNKMIIVLVGIMVLNLLGTAFLAFRQDGARAVETMKVGGTENMQLVKQLYSSDAYVAQQKAAIEQIVTQMGGTQPTEDTTTPTEDTTAQATDNNAVLAVVEAAKKDGYFRGEDDARIMILEYSEFLCPFCQRQHDNTVIEQIVDKYDGKVSAAFRHFIVHEPAAIIAQGAECVAKAKGEKAFYSYVDLAFDNIGSVDETKILSFAKDLGAGDISSCLDKGEFTATVNAQQAEGRSFGVSGTPGNVIIDTKTGKFVLVAGAYPIEKFVEEIDKLLAE